MKIYLAGTNIANMADYYGSAKQMEPRTTLRMLLSFFYFQKIDLAEIIPSLFVPPYPDIFADSGAFSAFTSGAPIEIGAYARWIKQQLPFLSTYANLDVIKNAKATWENQQRLEQEYGLSPLPVFHVCEPWEYLERYLERYSYIALGVAGSDYRTCLSWLVKCFKLAEGRNVAYHCFGVTAWEAIKSFPWYSVDSSTWCNALRYTDFRMFDWQHGNLQKMYIGKFRSKNEFVRNFEWRKAFREMGIDPTMFTARSDASVRLATVLSIIAYSQAEQWLNQYHQAPTPQMEVQV